MNEQTNLDETGRKRDVEYRLFCHIQSKLWRQFICACDIDTQYT